MKNNLSSQNFKGTLDPSTIDSEWAKPPPGENPKVILEHEKPPLHTLINSHDFELVASKTASKKTWAFYSSASTDLITRDANKSCFDRTWFRPRVLRNVREVDTTTNILGGSYKLPLFVSPAAMAKLIHPDGECAIARACGKKGIMQGVSPSHIAHLNVQTTLTRNPRFPTTPPTQCPNSAPQPRQLLSSSNST
jgi:L-lactate dehydrogenase (cytochrome)